MEITWRLIELKWSLGGPEPALAQVSRLQGAHLAFKEVLAAKQGNSRKWIRTHKERKALKRFKDACAFLNAAGCWIYGKDDH